MTAIRLPRAETLEQRLRRREQLPHRIEPYHASPAQGSVEYIVRSHQSAGVGEGGLATNRVAADLDQEHRLDARRRPQSAHEAARMADALDVEKNVLCLGVGSQVVQQLAEMHVRRTAKGNHAGEPDVVGLGPVENRRAQRARLRNQADRAAIGATIGEGGVQADLRPHDSQTVGADQTDAVATGAFQRGALERGALGAGFGKACRNHDGGADTRAAAGFHDLGDRLWLRGDDRQIEPLRNVFDRRIAHQAMDLLVLGIDREQLALETRVEHVSNQHGTDGALTFAGSDHGDRPGFEEGRKVMFFLHIGSRCLRAGERRKDIF